MQRPLKVRRLRAALPFAALLLLASSAPLVSACDSPTDGGDGGSACCKVCRTGKACGDTCISRDDTCREGRGCACNG